MRPGGAPRVLLSAKAPAPNLHWHWTRGVFAGCVRDCPPSATPAPEDSRGSGAAYWHRREKEWRKAGILFQGRPLTGVVFTALLEFQRHRCAVCGRSDAFESLGADHDHKGGELRGACDMRCNHRCVGSVERWGRYRNARVTAVVKAYLRSPPAGDPRFLDALASAGVLRGG